MTLDTHNAGAPPRPAGEPAGSPRTPASQTSPRFWRRPWIIPLLLVVVAFLYYQINPYIPEKTAPLPPHDGFAMYYPLLVVHIVSGTLAILSACFQVWPAMRKRFPRFHRVSGRVYVIGAVVGGVAGLILVRFAPPIGQIGVTLSTTLWIATTVAAFVAARRRNWELHRRFMLYSFALVMNNLWGVFIVNVGMALKLDINFTYYLEAARWIGWVANLMLVQWWLYHTAGRPLDVPSRKRVVAS
ncbi:DUF2306 domain-containing protein [Sphaerisporangium corydalis]|uniref:DUF2306 domain-containing protein n=1 Tax=Sphaerisporangium corydalis TaxID=1441875 RepID=A0ABV9EF24_9ACTN|nr:DUF2306 domain-containing protein [Sphaerisporangium corydalis]